MSGVGLKWDKGFTTGSDANPSKGRTLPVASLFGLLLDEGPHQAFLVL
jgi:hypothetical protein